MFTTYDIALRNQSPFFEAHQSEQDKDQFKARLAYFLASGHVGTTYPYHRLPHASQRCANIQHVAWTDHRILKRPDLATPGPANAGPGELVLIFSPGATTRDLAMADYLALLDGNFSLEPTAWTQLNALRGQAGKDKELLDALGTLAAMRGKSAEAEQTFREVLRIDPDDLTALSNLGVLLGKAGKIEESEAAFRKAFDRNEDSAGLAMNLARVECSIGRGEAARAALNAALDFNPHLRQLRDLAKEMSACGTAAGGK